MFREVYINLAVFGDGDIKLPVQENVYDTLSRHFFKILHVFMANYNYQARCFRGD